MNRVLIVEDEEHLADGLRFNLEADGFEVETAYNGELALDKFFVENKSFDAIVREVVRLGFKMVAEQIEAFGKMQIETNNILQIGAEQIEHAVMLVRGALEPRRSDLAVEDIEVASLIIVRAVVFLARIGVRDYDDLVKSGRYANEVATMVSRYLVGSVSPPQA
jgi:CheY-like chemotaxis protein